MYQLINETGFVVQGFAVLLSTLLQYERTQFLGSLKWVFIVVLISVQNCALSSA